MKIVYSGCKYNSIVFVADESQTEFLNWLDSVQSSLSHAIAADLEGMQFKTVPAKFNPIITPSSNPDLYPNELRCRLSTMQRGFDINQQVITTAFINDLDNKSMLPELIRARGDLLPIFKLGYYREGENVGVQLTLLKGLYTSPEDNGITNDMWVFAS
jgi:hypothetical protein